MIARTFAPPNFEVEAEEREDEKKRKRKWVTRGESEQAVAELLEEDWIIHSVVPYDFATWKARSEELLREVAALRQNGDKPDFACEHWRALKNHLFEIFSGKCAYCESFPQHVSSGDVEHFRPKRPVRDEPQHPGYYWLAYDESNLLPACEKCNRADAKSNLFPVEAGTRARDPQGVDGERPLLLNPYLDQDPQEHLRFLKTGHVKPRTPKGRQSISTYRLHRKDLRRRREDRLEHLEEELDLAVTRYGLGDGVRRVTAKVGSGEREFSAAQLAFIGTWVAEQQRDLEELSATLPEP